MGSLLDELNNVERIGADTIHSGCDIFLTNDSQFRRVSEIKVLVLSDFLLPGNNE
jgi:hypothetical protein